MSKRCQSCGKKATLAYNRNLRFFPGLKKMLCESCYEKLQRKEDLIFLGIIVVMAVLVVLLIFATNYQIEEKVEIVENIIDKSNGRFDLDKDGVVDFFESNTTDAMFESLDKYGYPWTKILSDKMRKRPVFMINRDVVLDLETNRNFHKYFHFPPLMKTYLKKLTSPESKFQLFRVFVTDGDEIVFLIHRFNVIPPGGFTNEMFISLPKGEEEKKPIPDPVEILPCMEPLNYSTINEMFGLLDNDYHVENFLLVKGPAPVEEEKEKK